MPKLTLEQRKAGYLEKGMWVVHSDHVGILVDFGGAKSIVHLVRENGTTIEGVTEEGNRTADVVVPTAALRQAKLKEIPEARRPSAAAAAELGYF